MFHTSIASGAGTGSARAALVFLALFPGCVSQGQVMIETPGTPSATAGSGTVSLECRAEQSGAEVHLEAMCGAMLSALNEATSAPVTRGQDGDLQLSLNLLRGTPAYLVARLDWQGAGTRGQGEQQSVGAVDATLNDRSYDQFARSVLSASDVPLP